MHDVDSGLGGQRNRHLPEQLFIFYSAPAKAVFFWAAARGRRPTWKRVAPRHGLPIEPVRFFVRNSKFERN